MRFFTSEAQRHGEHRFRLSVSVVQWVSSPLRHRDTEKIFSGLVSQWFQKPSQHHALDSLVQSWNVEVQDKPGVDTRQARICQDLGFVDRQNPVDGL
jgi:hypothetical protein